MAWAFLGGKTEQHYGILFLMLRAKALEKFQEDFAPEKIVSDFESGILSSVKIHLPNVEPLGCYFHYTQCVYRKTQNLGLVTLYKNTQTFQRTVRKIFALPFLPPNSVGQLYQTLRSDFNNRRLILLHPKVGDFFPICGKPVDPRNPGRNLECIQQRRKCPNNKYVRRLEFQLEKPARKKQSQHLGCGDGPQNSGKKSKSQVPKN